MVHISRPIELLPAKEYEESTMAEMAVDTCKEIYCPTMQASMEVTDYSLTLGRPEGDLRTIATQMASYVEHLIFKEFHGQLTNNQIPVGPDANELAYALAREIRDRTVRTYTWGSARMESRDGIRDSVGPRPWW